MSPPFFTGGVFAKVDQIVENENVKKYGKRERPQSLSSYLSNQYRREQAREKTRQQFLQTRQGAKEQQQNQARGKWSSKFVTAIQLCESWSRHAFPFTVLTSQIYILTAPCRRGPNKAETVVHRTFHRCKSRGLVNNQSTFHFLYLIIDFMIPGRV